MLHLFVLLALPCSLALSDDLLDGSRDTIRQFFELMYKVPKNKPTSAAGEPLLLTPLIEANKLKEAKNAAYCPPDQLLPGKDSYAGYLTVNKRYKSHLWFWYFPVSNQRAVVEQTPWIIWLQGGPGSSSLYGLFNEIGPFTVTDKGTLEEIKYSWGKNHSLLFIDNPVGTGFSFTKDKRGLATNQTTIGENLYTALQQFLTLFPELRKAPLTIAGESYAGKHIPSLGIQIHWNKHKDHQKQPINLHGLAIGNGFTDPKTLLRYSYLVREIGVVGDHAADRMQMLERQAVKLVHQGKSLKAFYYWSNILGLCLDASGLKSLYNYVDDDISLDGPYLQFIDQDKVRRALHVGQTIFTRVGDVYDSLEGDFMNSALSWLEELIDNYPVLSFSGQLDIIVAYSLSVHSYKSYNFTGVKHYHKANRQKWKHEGKVAGYFKTGGNFTELLIRDAGHMVPMDKPSAALRMITNFARGIPLDRNTRHP